MNCPKCSHLLDIEDDIKIEAGIKLFCSKCYCISIADENLIPQEISEQDDAKKEVSTILGLPFSCPVCDTKIQAATEFGESGSVPKQGDVTICDSCFSVLKIVENYNLKLLTEDEEKTMNPKMKDEIENAISFLKYMKNPAPRFPCRDDVDMDVIESLEKTMEQKFGPGKLRFIGDLPLEKQLQLAENLMNSLKEKENECLFCGKEKTENDNWKKVKAPNGAYANICPSCEHDKTIDVRTL